MKPVLKGNPNLISEMLYERNIMAFCSNIR